MFPARFELHRPRSIPEAIALLERHGEEASPYAGGTELLVAMKARVVRVAHVVDLKGIAALRGIEPIAGGGLAIGALATHHEIARDALVRDRFPAYAELSGNVANIRVRVAGTIGGNLCFAEPHADPPALLCALGAGVVIEGARGRRTLPVEKFLLGEFTTALEPAELLISIAVPAMPEGARAAYRAFGHLERPAAGIAALAVPEAGALRWSFWAGSVSGHPVRLEALEAALAGKPAAEALAGLDAAAEAAVQGLQASDDLHGSAEYKRHLAAVLAGRAARACLGAPEIEV